ncbi:2-dehydro-3-deoxygalactonokinase, partial [Acinetobacter baumannii]
DADAAAYASGLLIGSDVAARLAEASDAPIFILSGPELGNLYTAAIAASGRSASLIDSHAAFVAGILAIGASIA